MKPLFIAICILLASLAACSQKLSASKIPIPVRTAFTKAHPNAQASWEKEGINYEASFKEAGKTMSCVIDSKGTIIETETDIAVSKLPSSVRGYLKKHYQGVAIKEAARIEKNNGEVNYEAVIKGMEVLFDVNGKFIKEAKD